MPIISSRTPEGDPLQCSICREAFLLDTSSPLDDATCPRCGHLVILVSSNLRKILKTTSDFPIHQELELDSLDAIEFMHEIAEEAGLPVPAEPPPELRSVADIVRYLSQ